MKLTSIFRLRKPEGADPVNVEDFNDNFDVIDAELNKRPEKTGNASDMVTTFSQASSRTNLTPGEKISISFGKIMKWFVDLKTVAFSGKYPDLTERPTLGGASSLAVANNCTTTAAGSVLDARQGKVLMDKSNQLNRDLNVNTDAFAGYNLNVAIGKLLASFTKAGSYSGRFKCVEGWYTIHCFYAADAGLNSGYVSNIARHDIYNFYCKAGADAVLKKLGDVDLNAILVDHTHTINGNTALSKSYPLIKGTYIIIAVHFYGHPGSGVNNFGQASLSIKSSQKDTVITSRGDEWAPMYRYKIEVATDCTITLSASGRGNSDYAHAITSACISL